MRAQSWPLHCLALTACLVIAGCSSRGNSDYQQYFRLVREMWKSDDGVTLKEAAKVPYASLGVRIGSSRQLMLILGSETHGTMLWTSASRIVLVTREGRIIKTAGLPHNLAETVGAQGRRPLLETYRGQRNEKYMADFSDINEFNVYVTCAIKGGPTEFVTILGKMIRTVRIQETCKAERIGWAYTNRFWISVDSGTVWRSIQHIHPKLDPIELEILRPAS